MTAKLFATQLDASERRYLREAFCYGLDPSNLKPIPAPSWVTHSCTSGSFADSIMRKLAGEKPEQPALNSEDGEPAVQLFRPEFAQLREWHFAVILPASMAACRVNLHTIRELASHT